MRSSFRVCCKNRCLRFIVFISTMFSVALILRTTNTTNNDNSAQLSDSRKSFSADGDSLIDIPYQPDEDLLERLTDSGIWSTFPRIRLKKKSFATKKTDHKSTKQSGQPQQLGCHLPELIIDDPTVKHLFNTTGPLKCADEKNWVYVKNGTFYIDKDAERRHDDSEIYCQYTNFWRLSDSNTTSSTENDFPSGTKLAGDFFKADCVSSADGAVYSNVHVGCVASEEALKRAEEKKLPLKALDLNIYMLGFDSLSRLTFMRKLPLTYEYLTKKMGAMVLQGYNIVGDGTPQALIPILTGKTELELPLTRKRYPEAQYVDVYPFVWNEYRNAGYVTLYGEDAAAVGTFTYRLKGFDKQPTDHYMRTFYSFAELDQHKHMKYCWGSEPHHKVHFGYTEHFWEAYPTSVRKFAFQFHCTISHDRLDDVGMADQDMVSHLKYFVDRGFHNDTIFIFMSDHGHRFAELRETQQGQLEERLPFFSFAFPPWFAKKYPKSIQAFRKNTRRLTTPFDIHATLQTFLNFDPTPKKADLKIRGLSLFDEIPAERTCSDAGIEPHWCSCLEWTEVASNNNGATDNYDNNDPAMEYLANAVVAAINFETERERHLCFELKLKKLGRILKYVPSEAVLKYKSTKDQDGFVPDLTGNTTVQIEYYQLNFWTTPGDAHYEASVTYNKITNEILIDLDVISHVNAFGDKPHCIIDKDYFLAKWCVCRREKDRM